MHHLFPLTLLLALASALSVPRQVKISSAESAPNPIAQTYPNNVTGTINGTIAVVPIPYSLARSLIPAKYGILKSAYKKLLPNLPEDQYPLIVRTGVDHDIQVASLGLGTPDFQSAQIKFPFIDLLNNGYSSFAYLPRLLVSSTSATALAALTAYGINAAPGTFDPNLEAYRYSGPQAVIPKLTPITYNAYTVADALHPAIGSTFTPSFWIGPWPMNFYANISNQPIFGNGSTCDQQTTLFNTTLSTGKNAPVGVHGSVSIAKPYLDPSRDTFFDHVFGVKVDIAFIENNYLDCDTLKDLPPDTQFTEIITKNY